MIGMGLGMNGMEDRIAGIAHRVAASFDEVTYVEIGVAGGVTLTAIASVLAAVAKKWRAIGIELPDGYDFDRNGCERVALQRGLKLDFQTPHNHQMARPAWGQVTVYFKDSQSFLTEYWQEPIQLTLIDGCHGKQCVMQDFVAVEAFTPKAGVVMFHDFAQDQIGLWQPHCPGGVDVRGACHELGLTNGMRKGWTFTEEIKADRSAGAWDMGVFTKEV